MSSRLARRAVPGVQCKGGAGDYIARIQQPVAWGAAQLASVLRAALTSLPWHQPPAALPARGRGVAHRSGGGVWRLVPPQPQAQDAGAAVRRGRRTTALATAARKLACQPHSGRAGSLAPSWHQPGWQRHALKAAQQMMTRRDANLTVACVSSFDARFLEPRFFPLLLSARLSPSDLHPCMLSGPEPCSSVHFIDT